MSEAEHDSINEERPCERCGNAMPDTWPYGWCEHCCDTGSCRHGKRPENCNACMIESDLAYDSNR